MSREIFCYRKNFYLGGLTGDLRRFARQQERICRGLSGLHGYWGANPKSKRKKWNGKFLSRMTQRGGAATKRRDAAGFREEPERTGTTYKLAGIDSTARRQEGLQPGASDVQRNSGNRPQNRSNPCQGWRKMRHPNEALSTSVAPCQGLLFCSVALPGAPLRAPAPGSRSREPSELVPAHPPRGLGPPL